jgi:hypothetical protein
MSSASNQPRKRSRGSTAEAASPPVAASAATSGDNPDVAATATVGRKKREIVQLALDADDVLAQCRALRAKLRRKNEEAALVRRGRPKVAVEDEEHDFSDSSDNGGPPGPTGSGDGTPIGAVPADIVEVDELSTTEVLEGIEGIALRITQQVLARKGFSMEVPSRAGANQIYVREWDRIVLGGKRTTRSFMNVRESRKSAVTLRVMQLLHAVLVKRIHITKRDLFYTDVKLFVDQAESDGVLDDVATMIGCTRSNLHVVASDKGLVVGRIQFEEDGDPIDCTRMGVGGKAIPPYIDKIENIRSDAEFILLVEKEAAYMRMAVSVHSIQNQSPVVFTLPPSISSPHVFSLFSTWLIYGQLLYRRTDSTINIPASSLLPRASPTWRLACSWLGSPTNFRSPSWVWSTLTPTVSRSCPCTCRAART